MLPWKLMRAFRHNLGNEGGWICLEEPTEAMKVDEGAKRGLLESEQGRDRPEWPKPIVRDAACASRVNLLPGSYQVEALIRSTIISPAPQQSSYNRSDG